MSTVQLKGQVTYISGIENVGKNNTPKCTYRVKTDEKYPQEHDIEALGDACDIVGGMDVGATVTSVCNLRGNYWQKGDRCFTSLTLWKIEGSATDGATGTTESPPSDEPLNEEPPF